MTVTTTRGLIVVGCGACLLGAGYLLGRYQRPAPLTPRQQDAQREQRVAQARVLASLVCAGLRADVKDMEAQTSR